MTTSAELLTLLAAHTGRGRGLTAEALAARLGVSPRHVRTMISAMRFDGHAVCGTPGTGYYVAASAKELEETCEFLRERALHSLALEAALRRIPLPDLIGQLHLPT